MNNKKIQELIVKAVQLKEEFGGTYFSFPIEEDNPLSYYAVVICVDDQYFLYHDPCTIYKAITGIRCFLEMMKEHGRDADFDRNVRLVVIEDQMDDPNTVISKPLFEEGKDFLKGSEETDLKNFQNDKDVMYGFASVVGSFLDGLES